MPTEIIQSIAHHMEPFDRMMLADVNRAMASIVAPMLPPEVSSRKEFDIELARVLALLETSGDRPLARLGAQIPWLPSGEQVGAREAFDRALRRSGLDVGSAYDFGGTWGLHDSKNVRLPMVPPRATADTNLLFYADRAMVDYALPEIAVAYALDTPRGFKRLEEIAVHGLSTNPFKPLYYRGHAAGYVRMGIPWAKVASDMGIRCPAQREALRKHAEFHDGLDGFDRPWDYGWAEMVTAKVRGGIDLQTVAAEQRVHPDVVTEAMASLEDTHAKYHERLGPVYQAITLRGCLEPLDLVQLTGTSVNAIPRAVRDKLERRAGMVTSAYLTLAYGTGGASSILADLPELRDMKDSLERLESAAADMRSGSQLSVVASRRRIAGPGPLWVLEYAGRGTGPSIARWVRSFVEG